MLVIQLDKFDGDILYNGDYFAMIDEKNCTVWDDEMIEKSFTFGITTPKQNFYAFMFNNRNRYAFYDLENLEFLQGGYIK